MALCWQSAKSSLKSDTTLRQTPGTVSKDEACRKSFFSVIGWRLMSPSSDEIRLALFREVVPALGLFGIADLEVTYAPGAVVAIQGIQLRDSHGKRVARHVIPTNILNRIEQIPAALLQGMGPERSNRGGTLLVKLAEQKLTHMAIPREK